MFTQIDHVGIAVEDLDAAIKLWSGFGLTDVTIETVEEQGVKIAMLPVGGGGKVELLQPLNEQSPVAAFLAKRGPGMHHVAFRVDDVVAALAEAKKQGFQPLTETPRRGAGGAQIVFLHPRSTGGTLVELCQR